MSGIDATTFLGSAPLWALDAAYQANIRANDVIEAKITEKQAILTVDLGVPGEEPYTIKVFRRNAFPGRQSA